LRILYSAFSAYSPLGSESLVGYHYARILGRKHTLDVITCAPTDVTTGLAGVRSVHTVDLGGRDFNEVSRGSLLAFEARQIRPALRAVRNGVDLVHRVNPCSINDPTLLAFLNRPLVVGPILSSADPPESFREVIWREIRRHKTTAPLRERIQLLHRLGGAVFDPLRRSWTHLRKASRILVGSAWTMEEIPSRFHARCEFVVYAGVEHGLFTPPADGEGRHRNETPRLLWVSRLKPHKGIELLLRACGRLKDRMSFSLTIVGRAGAWFSGFLVDLVAELGLKDRVALIPSLGRERLPELYREHDIFCFPTFSDTYGVALLEAMSSGMAVVVSDIGGPREIVADGAGVRVPVVTPDQYVSDYAAALADLMENPRKRAELGRGARARILERHDWAKIEARLDEIYRTLP
jgi:glycosyltransferase involved in cell wall biosynthesis